MICFSPWISAKDFADRMVADISLAVALSLLEDRVLAKKTVARPSTRTIRKTTMITSSRVKPVSCFIFRTSFNRDALNTMHGAEQTFIRDVFSCVSRGQHRAAPSKTAVPLC